MSTITRLPALFISHGAPPLLDDIRWVGELRDLAASLPRPTAILVLSAHWESAPLTIGSTDASTPLTYDFWGFEERFYRLRYDSPGAPDLARRVAAMMPDPVAVRHDRDRRLDHGAFVPLSVMYPDADIPVLQVSLPTLEPESLMDLGRRLRDLRDEGVLVLGSGFTTHGLPYLTDRTPTATPPGWSSEFDAWTAERLAAADVDGLVDFRTRAPGMPYAHPTIEHFAPLFVALGASDDPGQVPHQVIDGFWMGLSKRSITLR